MGLNTEKKIRVQKSEILSGILPRRTKFFYGLFQNETLCLTCFFFSLPYFLRITQRIYFKYIYIPFDLLKRDVNIFVSS